MTTTTTTLSAPYLQEQRQFPDTNLNDLTNQVEQAYVDIAQKVNLRSLGLFGVNFPLLTGDTWYLSGSAARQLTFRQVYQFTTSAPIAHGINFNSVDQFTRAYGSYTNGSDPLTNNYFGVIYGTNVAIAGQVSFYIDTTNINILVGAAAPVIVSGLIVIEWLSASQSK